MDETIIKPISIADLTGDSDEIALKPIDISELMGESNDGE